MKSHHLMKFEVLTPLESKNLTIYYGFYQTAMDEFLIANTDKGICFMIFVDDQQTAFQTLKKHYPKAHFIEHQHVQQLALLSDTPQRITLHIKGTPFQLSVWQALLSIQCGQLSTYAQIAEQIQHPKAYRAVGSAVGKNPVAILIPCHRVIRKDGLIGDYRWGKARKMRLLADEIDKVNIMK